MRVLHLCSGNLYGGVERLLVTLTEVRNDHLTMESDYALCFEGRLSRELAQEGNPAHLLGPARASRPFTVWRTRRRLRELLHTGRYDVAVCHMPWAQALFGRVVRARGVPLVFWVHSPLDGRHWTERWARRTRPDLAICSGEFAKRSVARFYPGVKAEVVHGPVTFPDFADSRTVRTEVRRELGTPDGVVVVIQVSRLESWKGQEVHLEALGLLRDVPGWVCWLVGGAQRPSEARYLERLRVKAASLGIAERVAFLGERSDVPRLLVASDIFCQPNTTPDAMPRTLGEAMRARLPVVTTPGGGVPEIMDDSMGMLVPPGEARPLSAALEILMLDRELRERLGAVGEARARERFAPGALVRRLEGVLADLGRQRRRAS